MKAFGIELRKQGDTKDLYADVDLILSKSTFMQTQKLTVAHALQHMMKPDQFFDICTIRKCVDICHVHISAERYNCYNALHCIHWRDMLPDYKMTIVAMLLDDFRSILNN